MDAFAYLRKESLDIYNRIHSIAEDIHFVERVHEFYPNIPVIPNLRCGEWYTDPMISEDIPAYFKSTDGHYNNWSFNLRRANLHLLPFIEHHKGLILVDSTRAGKRIPDALSKTVPIWCCVINRAIPLRYPDAHRYNRDPGKWDTALYTPPGSVGIQEHFQIEQRLDDWAKALADSSFDLPPLSNPLRPFWITPSTSTFPGIASSNQSKFLSVICVSASRQTADGVERRAGGYTYIQGSGDDHELWGMGLDPKTFWAHKDELLSSDRNALVELVKSIASKPSLPQHAATDSSGLIPAFQISPITRVKGMVSIASASSAQVLQLVRSLHSKPPNQDSTIYIAVISHSRDIIGTFPPLSSDLDGDNDSLSNVLPITIPIGKRGQFQFLHDALPRSTSFIRSHLLHSHTRHPHICCVCDSNSGYDRSVGIALSVLQIFFDNSGTLREALDGDSSNGELTELVGSDEGTASKKSIQTRLEWIISSEPKANPSRTTLKRVNEYLMSPKSFRKSNLVTTTFDRLGPSPDPPSILHS